MMTLSHDFHWSGQPVYHGVYEIGTAVNAQYGRSFAYWDGKIWYTSAYEKDEENWQAAVDMAYRNYVRLFRGVAPRWWRGLSVPVAFQDEMTKVWNSALGLAAFIVHEKTRIPHGAKHPTRDRLVREGEEIVALILKEKKECPIVQ